MDNGKAFGILSVVLMLIGSLVIIFGSNSNYTAVKIFCILIGGVMSVISAFCVLIAIDTNNGK